MGDLCSKVRDEEQAMQEYMTNLREKIRGKDTVDMVNHPPHYTAHASGVECIQITEHMNFCLGNAVKYIWRADLKGSGVEDLKKAVWYLQREIARRGKDGVE